MKVPLKYNTKPIIILPNSFQKNQNALPWKIPINSLYFIYQPNVDLNIILNRTIKVCLDD